MQPRILSYIVPHIMAYFGNKGLHFVCVVFLKILSSSTPICWSDSWSEGESGTLYLTYRYIVHGLLYSGCKCKQGKINGSNWLEMLFKCIVSSILSWYWYCCSPVDWKMCTQLFTLRECAKHQVLVTHVSPITGQNKLSSTLSVHRHN